MSQCIFYVLDGLDEQQQLTFLCEHIASHWRDYRSVRVWCQTQQLAEQLDQALWQHPADAFVPHNLVGEGPTQGAPVEICWQGVNASNRRTAVIVNLMSEMPPLNGANRIIERVPSDDEGRQLARERFKQYRSLGLNLSTIQAKDVQFSS